MSFFLFFMGGGRIFFSNLPWDNSQLNPLLNENDDDDDDAVDDSSDDDDDDVDDDVDDSSDVDDQDDAQYLAIVAEVKKLN